VSLKVETLESIVEEKMAVMEESVHSFKHVKRVLKIAAFLARKEKADVELVQIGAFCMILDGL